MSSENNKQDKQEEKKWCPLMNDFCVTNCAFYRNEDCFLCIGLNSIVYDLASISVAVNDISNNIRSKK